MTENGGQQIVAKNSVTFCFDASSERNGDIGCKPARQARLPGGLCVWMQKAGRSPASKQNSVRSVLSVAIHKIRENPCKSVVKTRPHQRNL